MISVTTRYCLYGLSRHPFLYFHSLFDIFCHGSLAKNWYFPILDGIILTASKPFTFVLSVVFANVMTILHRSKSLARLLK